MAKFSRYSHCIKCGSDRITLNHDSEYGRSRMRRCCIECRYTWYEDPLDADDTRKHLTDDAIKNLSSVYRTLLLTASQ